MPLTDDVFVLLHALVIGKKGDDLVFTRKDGQPVRDFRDAWAALCESAGLGKFVKGDDKKERWEGLIFHDLRRSAVRNMVRRGVSQKIAMRISGHQTPSVFDRYDITDEADLDVAVEKIAAGKKLEEAKEAQVGHLLGTAQPDKGTTGIQLPKPESLPS